MGVAMIGTFLFLASLAGIVYPFRPFKKRWRALLAFIFSIFLIGSVLEEAPGEAAKVPPTKAATSQSVESAPPARPTRIAEGAGLGGGEQRWVSVDRLNRRTCPSERCGVVGRLFFREAASVLEVRDGWARISRYYSASCVNGRSEYVDSGDASCTKANGVVDGEFAEWVAERLLVSTRPPDPAEGASGAEALIAGSDDFARHRTAFAQAAQRLIAERRCTEADFRNNGGWTKSVTTYRNQPVYFTYCGEEPIIANRLYLNVSTGEVFR